MYDTIIFDVDGTLIDSAGALLGALQKTLKLHFNRDVEQEEIAHVLGIPNIEGLALLGIEDVELANRYWLEYTEDFRKTIRLYDGIGPLVAALKDRSVTTGVVTSRTWKEYEDDFVPLGLVPYLDYVVCADDTKLHKPHPEPLLKFLQTAGAAAETSIYIGDTIYDYECARDAGVDFGLALWGCRNPGEIPAKYKFAHPGDILELVRSQ